MKTKRKVIRGKVKIITEYIKACGCRIVLFNPFLKVNSVCKCKM